jgi:hypothetical protein
LKLTRDRAAAAALAALGAWAWWAAAAYPAGSLAQPGPGFVPRLLAALLFAFSVVLIVVSSGKGETRFPELGITLLIVLLLGAATFALERVGYRVTVTAFLFFFLAIVERRPVWLSALLSIGFSLASFYLINDVLRVPLPLNRWGW